MDPAHDELMLLADQRSTDVSIDRPLQLQHFYLNYNDRDTAIQTVARRSLPAGGKQKGRSYKQSVKGHKTLYSVPLVNENIGFGPPMEDGTALPSEDSAQNMTNALRLRDVAQSTAMSEQYIINLIERYQIIQPEKTGSYGTRPAYRFMPDDVQTLLRVQKLLRKGTPISEIRQLMSQDAAYQDAARKLADALKTLLTDKQFDAESWQDVVWALGRIPSLSEQEREVLLLIEGKDCDLVQTAAQLGLPSERAVRVLLDSAKAKLGVALLHVLRLAAEK